MVGFYRPLTGQIEIDNHPLQILDKHWVRENVTLIQQSSILFNDTFFKNVAFGHRNPDQATKYQVQSACDAALLQSTLSVLPDGLNTNVGSDGYNLSGGQKQRLALARARLRDPPVLILDEITSGLDQVSRVLIMDAIREWRRGKTTIIITHDVSQIGDDDFVYVMDNASLAQEGFRRDLDRQTTGVFAALTSASTQDAPDTPVDIGVHLPDCPSPVHLVVPQSARASRISRFLMGELERSSLSSVAGMSKRVSLGAGTAAAFRLRTEQTWQSDDPPQRLKPVAVSGPIHIHEKNSIMLRSQSSWNDLDGSSTVGLVTEEPSYVFGGADRRKNLHQFRLAHQEEKLESTSLGSPSSGDDLERMSLGAIFKTVWPAIDFRHRITLVCGIIVCFIGAVSIPVFSYCFAQLLGVMWSKGDKLQEGKVWALILIGVAVVDGLSTGGGHYLMEVVGQAWVNTIRAQALKRILRQPRSWFDKSRNSPGRINECLDRNSEEMRNIVGRFVPIIITVTVMILVSVIWSLIVSWRLTLVALAPLPIVMGAVKGYAYVSGKWEARCNKGADEASATLTEIFLNIRVVRALTLEKYMSRNYLESIGSTLALGKKRAAYTSPLFGLYQSLNYPLTALVFYYGTVLLASKGQITATAVVQVVNLLLFSMGTATGILGTIPQVTMAQATAAQVLGYASMPLTPSTEMCGTRKPPTPLPVRLTNLGFFYKSNSGRPVLRGVSFEVQPGDCLAIVGHSGCGKSTVISLLLGLYTPSRPTAWRAESPLTFAGIPHEDVDIGHLRSMMAYVPQAPFLFPASIAENISYGLSESSPLRRIHNVMAAASAAGLHDFILSLPEGYNTNVGEGGQALSGGQAQRLSIARALARKPRLLVLDEPTSALDAESSEMIRQTMQSLADRSRGGYGGMAIVVVTHSKEMMAIADRIVVLEEGTKVEEGTYHGLMQRKGPFAHLVSGGEWDRDEEDDR